MDEVIKLKASSEAEVQKMIKNTLHLKENEAVEIKVLKISHFYFHSIYQIS